MQSAYFSGCIRKGTCPSEDLSSAMFLNRSRCGCDSRAPLQPESARGAESLQFTCSAVCLLGEIGSGEKSRKDRDAPTVIFLTRTNSKKDNHQALTYVHWLSSSFTRSLMATMLLQPHLCSSILMSNRCFKDTCSSAR